MTETLSLALSADIAAAATSARQDAVISLVVSYVGTDFHGFQRQRALRSVQGDLEQALREVHGEDVPVFGASRTDAGVHARGQVVSFAPPTRVLPLRAYVFGVNDHLARDVRVLRAERRPAGFHARFAAREKSYTYSLDVGPVASVFLADRAWHRRGPLDWDSMQAAAKLLVGYRDFSAFQAAGGDPEPDTHCHLRDAAIDPTASPATITLRGNRFLYKMVRNIVGTLAEVGLGWRSAGSMAALLAAGDRAARGQTAPARGLCLESVTYEPEANATDSFPRS
ncbi:MAG: tRNA pseudouridine(38-40) synthase TruA [Candidatus Schekmanbacteria bacterium]|nr:tRNA pseudouridine(38-40) synthase TruA [Candidatus Schekmanbacteria bacterium]